MNEMGMLSYCDWSMFLAHDDSQFVNRFAFDMKADSPVVCQMLPSWLLMMMNSRQELNYRWLLLTNSSQKELQIRELKARIDFGDL
mmetsp:Transcript_27390/g.44943  ORF Transcript_27390/g.44943 Transcript_27390/m.44943 type:complete len:86 (+) Transcript_27390:363-620(+)